MVLHLLAPLARTSTPTYLAALVRHPKLLKAVVHFTATFYSVPLASAKAWLTQNFSGLAAATPRSIEHLESAVAKSNEVCCAANSTIVSQYLAKDSTQVVIVDSVLYYDAVGADYIDRVR
jgi:hypothetical protein